MTTAIVSDLHIGTRLEADVARRPEVRERLGAALADADHVVFLGTSSSCGSSRSRRCSDTRAPCWWTWPPHWRASA